MVGLTRVDHEVFSLLTLACCDVALQIWTSVHDEKSGADPRIERTVDSTSEHDDWKMYLSTTDIGFQIGDATCRMIGDSERGPG